MLRKIKRLTKLTKIWWKRNKIMRIGLKNEKLETGKNGKLEKS